MPLRACVGMTNSGVIKPMMGEEVCSVAVEIQSSTLELTERRVFREALNTHRLARNHIHNGSISRLEGFGVVLKLLAGAAINLLLELCKLAGDVSRVAVEHRSIAGTNLAGVIKDDHLQSKETTQMAY